jgi:FMN phosphatase YigB (HAD superfamily)
LTNAFRSARDEITQRWKISDALERLDVAAHQALFIDDVEENVAGARSVGMQALLFVTTAQATEDVGRWLA